MKQKSSISKVEPRPAKTVELSLDRFETRLALNLGNGDIPLGIRRAIALSGLRLERSKTVKSKCHEPADPLTLVTDQMADLAAELKELDGNPLRSEEIAVQIMRLGKLYLAIVNGTDVSLDDR